MPRQQLNYSRIGGDGRKESLESALSKIDQMFSEIYPPDGLSPYGAGIPGVAYRTALNLSRWRAALARVKAGTGRARVLFIGDSKTMGAGAGTDSSNTWTTAAASRSKPAHLAYLLSAAGIPAIRSSWFGSAGLASIAAFKAYDPRITGMAANWGGGGDTLGGVMWAAGASADNLVFTPDGSIDTYEIYHVKNTGDGAGTLTLDGSGTVIANFDGNAPAAVGKTVASFAKGAHALNLTRVSGGYLSFIGGIAYDSTTPAVDVICAGAFGTVSEFHTSGHGAWSAANCIAAVAPNLVVIQLGTNDLNTGVSQAAYLANITDIMAKAKIAGADVVLEAATFGASGGYGTDAQRNSYRQALLGLGSAQSCMVVDHAANAGSYAAANAAGRMRDAIHETELGYAAEAQTLFAALS